MFCLQKSQEREQYSGPARLGFSFSYSAQLNASILFGGCKDNDVYLFDHKKNSWSCKSTAGSKKQPPPRKYHAAAVLESGSALLVSGGQDENGRSLDDFYVLSLKEWKWTSVILQKEPVPRERHCLLGLSKSELLMFGGVSMPYRQYLNDCWVVSKGEGRAEMECRRMEGIKGTGPEGGCFAESAVVLGEKLYCGCQGKQGGGYAPIEMWCLQLRNRVWRKLQYKFVAHELKLYKLVSGEKEGVIISTNDNPKVPSPRFFFFSPDSPSLVQLENGTQGLDKEGLVGETSGKGQIVVGGKGKRLFALRYWIQSREVQPEVGGSVEEYLIAIKNEQVLTQQLGKKNMLLEQLYKEMQSYISSLNREYQHFQRDEAVQIEKERHIEDCQILKTQYVRLNTLYEQACSGIRDLRGELSAIDEEFQRCIETEFDEEA